MIEHAPRLLSELNQEAPDVVAAAGVALIGEVDINPQRLFYASGFSPRDDQLSASGSTFTLEPTQWPVAPVGNFYQQKLPTTLNSKYRTSFTPGHGHQSKAVFGATSQPFEHTPALVILHDKQVLAAQPATSVNRIKITDVIDQVLCLPDSEDLQTYYRSLANLGMTHVSTLTNNEPANYLDVWHPEDKRIGLLASSHGTQIAIDPDNPRRYRDMKRSRYPEVDEAHIYTVDDMHTAVLDGDVLHRRNPHAQNVYWTQRMLFRFTTDSSA